MGYIHTLRDARGGPLKMLAGLILGAWAAGASAASGTELTPAREYEKTKDEPFVLSGYGSAVMADAYLEAPQYGGTLMKRGVAQGAVYRTQRRWQKLELIERVPAPSDRTDAGATARWFAPTREGAPILRKALEDWQERHQPIAGRLVASTTTSSP